MDKLRYSRVLFKLSGEALAGPGEYGVDPATITGFCEEIANTVEKGLQLAPCYRRGQYFSRAFLLPPKVWSGLPLIIWGMLATVMNALAVQDALEKQGLQTRVLSAISMREVCEPYIRRRAVRHLEKGRVVICAAGTGNPYFTTDTAAALRAMELKCEAIIKGTKS